MSLPAESAGFRTIRNPLLRLWLVAAAFSAAACSVTVFGAEGELRWPTPYAMDSTNLRPTIESSPAIDSDGVVYVGLTLDTSYETGAVVAITPISDSSVRENWRWSAPDRIEATPLVAGDTVYVGCFDGVLYALDKTTGAVKWAYDTNLQATELTYIHSTAALSRDGRTVYVGVGTYGPFGNPSHGAVFAVSTSGRFEWASWVDGAVESSPAVSEDGTIYVGSWDKHLYAISPDGRQKWRRPLAGEIWGSPAIGPDGTVYIGCIANEFIAVTPDNVLKWSQPITAPGSAAIGADGTVYVGSWGDSALLALQPRDGSLKWDSTGQPSRGSTPTVRGDGVVIYGGEDDILRAYNPADGAVRWSYRTGYRIYGAPAIAPTPDHSIFIGSGDGRLYCLRGNGSGLSEYSSWPTFQRNIQRSGQAAERFTGGRLANLATRGFTDRVNPLIAGFVLDGTALHPVLARAVGPTLAMFGIAAPLSDPSLEVRTSDSFLYLQDDNWGSSREAGFVAETAAKVGAFPLPLDSRDAAVAAPFAPGLRYTGVINSVDGSAGIALAELYDADLEANTAWLKNLSTRGYVGKDDNVLIAGLVVRGPGKVRVLIRGVGPGLSPFGVSGVLPRPRLALHASGSTLIASNTGWASGGLTGDLNAAGSLVGAFPLDAGKADSAMIVGLEPGAYTVLLSGLGSDVGVGLVEIYLLPH